MRDAARNQRAAAAARAEIDRAAADAAAAARPTTSAARFRAANLCALGPIADADGWLVTEVPRPTATAIATIAGTRYRQLTGCKPHDCFDNNALVLYAPQTGTVYGLVPVRGVPRRIGAPPPDVADTLERLWRAAWRQGR